MFKGLIQPNESFSGDAKARVVASGRLPRHLLKWGAGRGGARPASEPGAVGRVGIRRRGVIDSPALLTAATTRLDTETRSLTQIPVSKRKVGRLWGPASSTFRASTGSEKSVFSLPWCLRGGSVLGIQ